MIETELALAQAIPNQSALATPWIVVLDGSGEPRAAQSGFGQVFSSENWRETGHERILRVFCPSSPPSLSIAASLPLAVAFDGFLYDRPRLIERFADSLAPFASNADLMLRAWRLWGEDIANQVGGNFALIVWDARRNLLFCMRDRLGTWPFFYALNDTDLILSNSIETLVRHPRVSREVNRAALAEHLCHSWVKQDETYYSAVRRIPQGHILRRDREGLRTFRYWNPGPADSSIRWVTEGELGQFDILFDQAVTRCLDLGQASVFLSGGFDSVSVAGVAADRCRQSGRPVPLALSMSFPPPADEEGIQRSVSAALGLPQIVTSLAEASGPEGLVWSAMEDSASRPAPMLNIWSPAYRYLGRKGRDQDRQVILTGNGGDEWLTVSPSYAADLMSHWDVGGLFRLWTNMQRSFRSSIPAMARMLLWSYGARLVLGATNRRFLRRVAPGVLRRQRERTVSAEFEHRTPSWVSPDRSLRQDMFRRFAQPLPPTEPASFYLADVQRSLESPVVALELEEFFESGQRMGTPMLHPFWDADLVDFLYRTPPHLLNRGGRSKGLVRGSLARRYPGIGFDWHKKLGATQVFQSVMVAEGLNAWKRIGGAQAMQKLGLVDPKGLETHLSGLFQGKDPLDLYRIWYVLSVEAWLRPRVFG